MKKEDRIEKKVEKKQEVKQDKITFSKSKEEEFSQWYSEIVEKAELVRSEMQHKRFCCLSYHGQ